MKKRSVLFIVSDFMDSGYEKRLNQLALHHDVILIQVIDPIEEKIPYGAVFTFKDLETGEIVKVDNRKNSIELPLMDKVAKRNLITIRTDEDYVKKLSMFFKRRLRR